MAGKISIAPPVLSGYYLSSLNGECSFLVPALLTLEHNFVGGWAIAGGSYFLMTTRQITVAHSPDSDDAFMFYALATNKIKTGDLKFNHVLSDIETLNKKALNGEYEVTAVSFHAYAYLAEKYALLSSGASMSMAKTTSVATSM